MDELKPIQDVSFIVDYEVNGESGQWVSKTGNRSKLTVSISEEYNVKEEDIKIKFVSID
jgi:hypothetical protein